MAKARNNRKERRRGSVPVQLCMPIQLCGMPLLRSGNGAALGRQTSTLHVLLTKNSEEWTSSLLESLDELLGDSFATNYLLRFAATEFNSENISFLVEARRYFLRPGAPTSELRTCLAAICLPADLKARAKEWLRAAEPSPEEEHDLITQAFKLCRKTVEHDTFLRFKSSEFCSEMRALHLSNMLQRANFRAFLGAAQLTDEQVDGVQFWVSANGFEAQHTSLASGWAAESTVSAAKQIFAQHEALLRKAGLSDAALGALKKRLPVAPQDLFVDAQRAVLNFLTEPYERLLDAPSSEDWLQNAGLARLSTASTTPSVADLEASCFGLDDEDYASCW